MKATKKQIDDFIEYEVKVPSSTYSFYERRQAVRYVKNNLSFSSSIFLKECWAVLYHVDRTNIIDNNDLNLLRYLLKLMLYTLNGETDNSWLEDKYKEYHEKYDFSKDKSFTSGAKKEVEDDEIKYVNGELKYKCSDGLAKDILKELDDKKEAYPHILEEYLLKLVLFANKKKTSKKELENILRVLIPELLYKYDTRDIEYIINTIIQNLWIDNLILGYTLSSYVSSYKIRVEEIDMLAPVYRNMKEVLILVRDRNKISPGGQYENIGWFRHVLSTSVNYEIVHRWDNLIRLVTGNPTYSNYEIAEFIKGFENESIQTSSLQIAGYIAKYYYDDFVFDLLQKNVDEDLLFSVCNRIGIKEYFYRRYKKVKGVSFSKRDSSSAPKDNKYVKGVGVDLIKYDEVAESVNKAAKEALTHKIGENKTLVTEVGIKKEEELTYDDGKVDWCPDDDFIEEITKQTKGYNKNKQLFAHTVWRMVSFIQNENTDISLYKEIVKTLCLEIYDEPSTVDINDIIIEIKNTFQIGDVGFTYDFETWVDSILDKEDLVDYLYLHPEIVEKELEGIKTNTDRYEIFSMEDLRQELKCSVFNVLLAINAVYKLFKGTADSRQHFIKGIKRESINKLTTHWVAGFIISCINKQPVKELIDMYQTEEDTLSIILETCKAMNIQKHFYNEYKKIMGVSYTNRFNSSAAKKIKGVEGDNRVVDELRVIEIKQPAEKVEQIITFDTETSYVTDFQKVKLRDFQKEFLKKESENSLKLGVKENTETHSESFKNPLTNTSINTKELINKLEENFIKPDVIYITKEGFAEMQKYPLSETSSEVKKNPRKEAYIKGIYLGIVRELVKNTKELFASSFNNPSIISIVNTALGDVVISVILVEILPTIDFGARKEFVEKVVELLKLNTSVAIGEFATNMLIGIGKELAKENKIQDLVKQVVTV